MDSLGDRLETTEVDGALADALGKLLPFTGPGTRELFINTTSEWIAYFDNSVGGDPGPPVSYLSKVLGCRSLLVACSPDIPFKGINGSYGGVQLHIFAPEGTGGMNYERVIEATNDGGRWVFDTSGTVQDFEQLDRYKARKVRDRFTPQMLEEYCAAMGIRLFDADFYGPEGLVFADPLPPTKSMRVMTLHEARIWCGIEKDY